MKRSIVVFSLMAMSGLAFADGFSYTYVQATYGKVDIDDPAFSEDGDGLGVNGSFGITDNLNIVASFQTADFDTIADADEITVGLGVHAPITEMFDIVAAVSYVDVDLAGFSDDGFELAGGVRFSVASAIEINGGITYRDLDLAGDDIGFGAGALYNFTDMFSVGLSAKWQEKWGADTATYALSGRINFGN